MKCKSKNDYFLYFSAISINLLSFGAGTVFSWTSPVFPQLKSDDQSINPLGFKIGATEQSLIASIQSLGAALGPFIASQCADRFGRRKSLHIFFAPLVISYLTLAFAQKVELYYFARFLIGVGLGCVLSVIPMYIGEISKNTNRGLLGCFTEVFITVGELFCVVVGFFTNIQWLSIICVGPFVIFLIISCIFIPESPYYHVLKGDSDAAKKSLRKFRQCDDQDVLILREFDEIERNVKESLQLKRSFQDLFKSKELVRGLVISVGLMLCQQMCGISAIIFYLEPIFRASSTSVQEEDSSSDLSPIIFSIVQVIFCCLAARFIEKLGRRVLLIVSEAGLAISLVILGAFFYLKENNYSSLVDELSWLPLASLILYIMSFAFGIGPLAWAMLGELFPPDVKASAAPLTTSSNMVFAYVTTAAFPYFLEMFGMAATLWIFSLFCVLGLFFVVYVVPETKGKSLDEIQICLGKKIV